MSTIIYIGINVHKDTYTLSSFLFSTNRVFGQSTIANSSNLVNKYVEKIQKEYPEFDVLCGYEAGPTGYGLYRDLERYGIPCVIMAPTTLPKASGDRVKNDRLDAQLLSKQLAFGTYSAVYVPTTKDEAVKNFTRLRNTRKIAHQGRGISPCFPCSPANGPCFQTQWYLAQPQLLFYSISFHLLPIGFFIQ